MSTLKKVLVTGATGYIGSHVIRELAKYPKMFKVIATYNTPAITSPDIQWKRLDITNVSDYSSLYGILGCPDTCLHLAWQDGFEHNSPSHLDNLSSHFKFLVSLAKMGTTQLAIAA